MKYATYLVLFGALTALGCSADTSNRASRLRAHYNGELGQLVIAGQSNWDGLADIWVDEEGELVNYGPLELEGSIQLVPGFFAADYNVSIRERVTEEVRDVLLVGNDERAAAIDVNPDDISWSSLEDIEPGEGEDADKTSSYCRRYMMPVLNNHGQACLIQHCANGRRTVVACWDPNRRYR